MFLEAAKRADDRQDGPVNEHMVCPHCQTRGSVRCKKSHVAQGISGGKATAALVTGGVSVLATGLSRVEERTQAKCDICNSRWSF